MKKVNYTFRTKDKKSYITIIADNTDIGEARAFSIAKAEFSLVGEDIEGVILWDVNNL